MTPQGIEILIPASKRFKGISIVAGWGIWSLIFFKLITPPTQEQYPFIHMEYFWVTWGIGSVMIVVAILFEKKKLLLTSDGLTLWHTPPLFTQEKTHYNERQITNLRFVSQKNSERGKLVFDYQYDTIRLASDIDQTTATQFIHLLSDILAFRCHAVEGVLFSSLPIPEALSRMILQNPDVSSLTCPFVRLYQVIIYPKSYDFHLVERFLTYAVNALGQDYLRRCVDVHLYGEPQHLHPNLLNTLTNLCKQVYVHDEQEGIIPFS